MTIYIARISSEGEIESMWTTGAIPDIDEGPDEYDNTKTIVHVTGALADLSTFMNTHYYKDGAFEAREARPGEYYNWINETWVLNSDNLMRLIRTHRDSLLFQCDWTQIADSPLTDEKKVSWAAYRQYLREVPSTNTGLARLDQVAWPTPPT